MTCPDASCVLMISYMSKFSVLLRYRVSCFDTVVSCQHGTPLVSIDPACPACPLTQHDPPWSSAPQAFGYVLRLTPTLHRHCECVLSERTACFRPYTMLFVEFPVHYIVQNLFVLQFRLITRRWHRVAVHHIDTFVNLSWLYKTCTYLKACQNKTNLAWLSWHAWYTCQVNGLRECGESKSQARMKWRSCTVLGDARYGIYAGSAVYRYTRMDFTTLDYWCMMWTWDTYSCSEQGVPSWHHHTPDRRSRKPKAPQRGPKATDTRRNPRRQHSWTPNQPPTRPVCGMLYTVAKLSFAKVA